jgi:uncharacterized protein (TIGR02271 family)
MQGACHAASALLRPWLRGTTATLVTHTNASRLHLATPVVKHWRTDMNYDQVAQGWTVYDSNDDKVGDVAEVGANYLLVQKGLIFIKDVYVPMSAVASADPGTTSVYLNTTKSAVENMGWDEPPTRADVGASDRAYGDTNVGDTESQRLTLHEEELQAQTRRQQAGEVSVNKRVVEDARELDVPVTHDEVQVKRVRVDRDAVPGDATFADDGETIRVPVTAETVEVSKTPRVVEELEISKRPVTEHQTVRETVRREEADVDRAGDVTIDDGSRDLVGSSVDRMDRTSTNDV